jgi:predicted N-acetyltransferase YhbS
MIITQEQPVHAGAIEALLDNSFGPKRHSKTVYRLRNNVDPIPELGFVALDDDPILGPRLIGTIRYWPILVGSSRMPSIMLGPIAIAADLRSNGLGSTMIRHSLARAAELGHQSVILVGDPGYYARFGFSRDHARALSLPGPVDPDRFQGLELVPGALADAKGAITRVPVTRVAAARVPAARMAPLANDRGAPRLRRVAR